MGVELHRREQPPAIYRFHNHIGSRDRFVRLPDLRMYASPLIDVFAPAHGPHSTDFQTPPPPPPPSSDPPLLSTSPVTPGTADDPLSSCLVYLPLCIAIRRDARIFSIAAWSTLQLTWTIVLLASQLWQMARQMTTLEVSNLGRFGFMGGRGGMAVSQQQGQGQMQEMGAHDHHHGHGHGHRHGNGGVLGCLMAVLGFDRFTKGKAADGLAKAAQAPNPFNLGWVANCEDFWTTGRELGVDYRTLYDIPEEGFREAKRRKVREEAEDGFAASGKRSGGMFARTMSMGRSFGRNGARAGYEPLNADVDV